MKDINILNFSLLIDLIKKIKETKVDDFEIFVGRYGNFERTKELFYFKNKIILDLYSVRKEYEYFINYNIPIASTSSFIYTNDDTFPGFQILSYKYNFIRTSKLMPIDIDNLIKELNNL